MIVTLRLSGTCRVLVVFLSCFCRSVSSLTSQQLEAVSLLSSGFTQAETAEKIGVSERTVQRWVKIPCFAEAVNSVGAKVTEATIKATSSDLAKEIKRLLPKAITTLETILDNPDTRNADKLRASEILGRWAGLTHPQPQQQTPAEENLKNYLNYLASTNGKTPN